MEQLRWLIAILQSRMLSGERDFGWGYKQGQQPCAEATTLATLACWQHVDGGPRKRLLDGIRHSQRGNGGWSALSPLQSPSNWPTALVAAVLTQLDPQHPSLKPALRNLITATPEEAFWLWRLKFRTADRNVRFDPSKYGWGWVAGTSSWTIPTAMAVIALCQGRDWKVIRGRGVDRRLELGCSMLLDRMCPGGGWNAGNSVVYGVALPPNIEATAIALAALRGRRFEGMEPSLSFLVSADCQSAYSLAWKILALREYAKDRPELRTALEQFRGKLELLVEDPRQIEDNATLALSVLAIEGRRSPLAVGASI